MSTTVRALKATVNKTEAPAATGASCTQGSAASAPSILPEAVAIAQPLIEQAASAWWDKLTERQRQAINGRFERGKAVALAGEVDFTDDPQVFKVRSQSTRGDYRYTVTLDPDNRSCSCPDLDAPYGACKHMIAANIIKKALELSQAAPAQPASPEPAAAETDSDEAAAAAAVGLNYQIRHPKDTIVYGKLNYKAAWYLVEILWTDSARSIVRALPRIENGEAIPVFPFPSPFGAEDSPCWSTAEVNNAAITGVKIYC